MLENSNLTRRKFVQSVAAMGAVATVPAFLPNSASAGPLEKALADAGDKGAKKGKVKLVAPTIAENGAVVPIKVDAGDAANVESITVIADKNPAPLTIKVNYTPDAGKAEFQTRMRLRKTSLVRAYAKMKDGTVYVAQKSVKVTIGGCG